MICSNCNYQETTELPFIGLFTPGTALKDSLGNQCSLFSCPKCHVVMYNDDIDYLNKKKLEYKERMKSL